ncbi:aspartate ammonia-lyase [candidate division KSB3 bacterium]|uniref:Aspartate ammonia-lyase n=1 Tax=candidate division KSB3 bacterium TaxID=2044937 RepID=A0A2G6K6K1_9BACT|nr:MAG: aspartate ammonia-lyase [candidate division KSB3 bacterium]
MGQSHRIEHDLLGEQSVPSESYWGIHTERALDNFSFSLYRMPFSLIRAIVLVKKACCLTNKELAFLEPDKAMALEQACDDILEGRFEREFPIDALQGGAGTSANMNVNEVLANRAQEILGFPKGDYTHIHPIEHVNLHQSTNDVYPTALKIAAIQGVRDLSQAIAGVQGAFQRKEKAFAEIVTMGRTELQQAVPITLGGQFASFAEAIARDRWRTFKCEERLRVVNIGGTAVGTGLTAPREYIFLVIERLRDLSGIGLSRGEHVMDQTANADSFVEVSGMLAAHGANVIKICRDLRLLHFLNEISLPACQAGSSIMPGKINPVILEAAMTIGMKVQANDLLVTQAASQGTLQINEFLPLIAFSLLESIELLTTLNTRLEQHIEGIEARPEVCRKTVEDSPLTITAFLPHIGYEAAEQLLQEFAASPENVSFYRFLTQKLGSELVEQVLSPHSLMALGYRIR